MSLLREVFHSQKKQLKRRRLQVEYNSYIADLMNHPKVRQMDFYPHHASVTCLEHCLSVSYYSFRLSRRLKLDARAAARSGLLHDLYLYDWHINHPVPGLHGLTHPQTALANARRYFELSSGEEDAILCHMWPLTFKMPGTKESWMICLMDKYCALVEVSRLSSHLKLYPHNASGRLASEQSWRNVLKENLI
ncbi:MAG: phosphohydrolase [Clostridiaceae bacterium]|nr:phosphohydrolase [Clostridiaceae bacterium]